jgi:hypothetical protein
MALHGADWSPPRCSGSRSSSSPADRACSDKRLGTARQSRHDDDRRALQRRRWLG